MMIDPRSILAECHRRGPWLTRVALAHLVVLIVLLMLMIFDDRLITGVNIWLKPAKFALSISVYLLTMAWLLGSLQNPRWLLATIAAVIIAAMMSEQILITLQAARGTTSHYNNATPFDAAVFSIMGLGTAANTIAVVAALVLFSAASADSQPAYFWGIRFGLAIFLLGSAQGFLMITNDGHTVGAPDGNPGIPLFAWSTSHGDLRITHFFGIHAIQILPFAGWLLDRHVVHCRLRLSAITLAALAWATLTLWILLSALAGQPPF